MRSLRLLLATCPLLAAACGASSDEPASFAAMSADQRFWAAAVASGSNTQGALSQSYDQAKNTLANHGTCPTATVHGDMVTLKGGCTLGAEVRIDGSVTLGGFPQRRDESGIERSSGRWDHYRTEVHVPNLADGTIEFDGSAESEDSASELHLAADLTITRNDTDAGHLDAELRCDASHLCTAAEGARLTINGVGADIVGAWNLFGKPSTGTMELRGSDVLRVDFADRDARGCFGATVAGAATDRICLGIPDNL